MTGIVVIQYLSDPNPEQRARAADLIDSGGQLAEKLDRAKFARSCVIVVAVDEAGSVIGTGAVKERRGAIAETGYLITDPAHLRKGIAAELTRRRIEAARDLGLELLFTNVRQDNHQSISNLLKAEFRFWDDFVSAYDTGRIISWYYMPLRDGVDWKAHLESLTRKLKKAPAPNAGTGNME